MRDNLMLESDVETNVVNYAKSQGFEVRKMRYIGRKGCRDYDVYGYGHHLRIEFKRPKGSLRIQQERERDRLLKCGLTTYVVSSVDRKSVV